MGMVRWPREDVATTLAPRMRSDGGGSIAGSAWAMPPPTVATFRMRMVATRRYASASRGAFSFTTAEVSMLRWVTSPPMLSVPLDASMLSRPWMRWRLTM